MPASRAARPWIVVGALLWGAFFGWPRSADAETVAFDLSSGAIVQIVGHTAAIVVRTWPRDTIRFSFPDGRFRWTKSSQQTGAGLSFLIPGVNVEENRPAETPLLATLLPEDFPVPGLAAGPHDVVRIVEEPVPAGPSAHGTLTVTIPESTGMINLRSGRGAISLTGYHGTTMLAVNRGAVAFDDVSGDAFVQPLNGRFHAKGSTFERLRIRSNRANLVFETCRVRQIEASTLSGTILFDNGTFEPGLARFQSDRGAIALGVNGGAQLGAHTEDGHIFTSLPQPPSPSNPAIALDEGDSVRTVGNGGPLVNASSTHGNVYLYDGSLAARRPDTLAPDWYPVVELLLGNRTAPRPRVPFAAGRTIGRPAPRPPHRAS